MLTPNSNHKATGSVERQTNTIKHCLACMK